jgi:hypothetical protein
LKKSPLAAFVGKIKEEHKALDSPSATLAKLIDDYCKTPHFDTYLAAHRHDLVQYVDDKRQIRKRFRASAAGKCQQQQAFSVLALEGLPPGTKFIKSVVDRPARQYRALHNGTFSHLRWHLVFDALHEQCIVTTYRKEAYRVNHELDLDGTCDRIIGFPFDGREIVAIIDFKTIKSRYFERLIRPQDDHRMQHHAYRELHYEQDIGRPIDCWLMLYEDKNDHTLKIYDQPYDELTIKKLRRMYRDIPAWLEEMRRIDLPKTTKLPLIVTWCKVCEYQDACLLEHPDLKEQQLKIGEADE